MNVMEYLSVYFEFKERCYLYMEYAYLALTRRVWDGSMTRKWLSAKYWQDRGIRLEWDVERDWLPMSQNCWANSSRIMLIDEKILVSERLEINRRFELYTNILHNSNDKFLEVIKFADDHCYWLRGYCFMILLGLIVFGYAMMSKQTIDMYESLIILALACAIAVRLVHEVLVSVRAMERAILGMIELAEGVIETAFPEVMHSVVVKAEVEKLKSECNVMLLSQNRKVVAL
jgi:hypothetical protein